MSETAQKVPISQVTQAVDADDEQFRLLQHSAAMMIVFNRRRRVGGIPDRKDVADYEAICSILGRAK